MKSIDIFGNKLIIKTDVGSGRYYPLYKTKVSFYKFTANYSILTSDLKFLLLARWGEDEELLFLHEANDVDVCYDLYFINKEEPSRVPLPCSVEDSLR